MRAPSFRRFNLLAAIVLTLAALLYRGDLRALAQSAPETIVRQPDGAVIVPEKFLRSWDPVTIFFHSDTGPQAGGAEHDPDRFVSVSPEQPGAFTWLNARTLQFRPAEPWPALGRYLWRVGDHKVTLVSLMSAPQSTTPADGATGLAPVSEISLEFADPVDPVALAQMLDIEFAPLPGLDTSQVQRVDPNDFTIKTVERTSRSDPARYVVDLRQPIPAGMRVVVMFGLSTDPALQASVERIQFSTEEAFHPAFFGCADKRVPIGSEGNSYGKSAALACAGASDQPADGSVQQNWNGQDNSSASGDDDSSEDASDSNGNGNSNDQAEAGDRVSASSFPTTSNAKPALGARDRVQALIQPQPSAKREIVVQFSAQLGPVDPVTARNLVRITPSVDQVKTIVIGDELHVSAHFQTDTLYQIVLVPTSLKDSTGRDLAMAGRSAAYVYWPTEVPFLNLAYGNGTVERYGPQMVPAHGRGYAQADVRIHAIDPLDRSFWPFPASPVTVDESVRPPSPGEEVTPHASTWPIDANELTRQIERLGSPSVSELMQLPLKPLGSGARFGLDLSSAFARISGKAKPGTYLVGIRRLDKEHTRDWMRVQVTDLSVNTVEEEHAVRFYVTSLSDGFPVQGAKVRIEGEDQGSWKVITSGLTGPDGHFTWDRPDLGPRTERLRRISIINGDDVLVLDPDAPPDRYSVAGWVPGSSGWLGWMGGDLAGRHPAPSTLCHIFTERPIYRPDDPVHIKAYVRQLANGALTPGGQGKKSEIVVTGPDDDEWRQPVTLDDIGNVHYLFDQKTTETGMYEARIEIAGEICASVRFKKDDYRLPKFQVRLSAPGTIPLDKPASVAMTAIYYAGGAASGRPVRWRVTEFPYAFTPPTQDGFLYATDERFEASVPFQGAAAVESQGTTDREGRATLALDPTAEKTNQPRRYVVEATVIGDDDKTVTNTENVLALPAFVLGLKVPRFVESSDHIPVAFQMVDADGKPIAGRPVTLRLLQRQWSSILEASDFTDGKPKYRTDVVDQKRLEKTVTSTAGAVTMDLPISEAGVYIVQVEASDDLGRLQTVSIDLFASGNQPVTWSRPPAQVFKVTTDKPFYVPGDVATMILESPFQTARALAIVEEPDGSNSYDWVPITHGYGKFRLSIDKNYMPRLPVHFALMRGRIPDADDGGAGSPGALDLRRPETIAATAWIGVKPAKNIVTVTIENPSTALPGDTISLKVKLTDDLGQPISGEVTLWLIDQAVLALAHEAPLDPLPNFIRDRGSHVAFSDTRNSVFGSLPLDEDPGGDIGAGDQALLNKVTIRKNFTPIPYYNPTLEVDASGVATVQIKLPDNLTNFMIRAKATSGADRFGFGTGQVSVRLPVIVEPNLPRFVRPGDQFTLSAIGRVVEGPGGPGRGEAKVDGLTIAGPLTRDFVWAPGQPQRLEFAATVPSPAYDASGTPLRQSVSVTLGVERTGDKARDAFAVELPLRPDRFPVRRQQISELAQGKSLTLPAISEPVRPGTLRRSIVISSDPMLLRLMAGLDYLREYPFGCAEQRISQARGELAAKQFAATILSDQPQELADRHIQDTLAWLANVTDDSGLVAFWPGMKGEVLPTAWALEFMVEAQKAGFTVDPAQMGTLKHALQQALRSDYANFVSSNSFTERSWALSALATAGDLDSGYASELMRQANYLSTESAAEVRLALASDPAADPEALKALEDALWKGIIIKQRDGQPVYGGLQQDQMPDPLILPSETRTIAEALRALSTSTSTTPDPRRKLLADALVTLGAGNGWGDTNATAEALLALSQYATQGEAAPVQSITVGGKQVQVGGTTPFQKVVSLDPAAMTLSGGTSGKLTIEDDVTYMPAGDGSQVAPASQGFVVTRQISQLDPSGAPARKLVLDAPGKIIALKIGDVVEDSLELVNPVERHHVAIVIPLAAGMEPLNPTLATAPPEATPSAEPTLAPAYTAYLDDQITYFYETLPAGTYHFYFRSQAGVAGRFIQPAAYAMTMYDSSVAANGAGAVVSIVSAPPPASPAK